MDNLADGTIIDGAPALGPGELAGHLAALPDWHLAADGATSGPFGDAELAKAVTEGRLTRATMVWTPGQDGWKMAAETELARLLDQVPPPPPKP